MRSYQDGIAGTSLALPLTVRVVLMSMLVMLAAPRAEACPTSTVCAAVQTQGPRGVPADAVRHEIAQARAIAPRSMMRLAITRENLARALLAERSVESTDDRLAGSLRTHVVPRARSIEMPWVWQMLRHTVYARMPRYDRAASRTEHRFSLVLSPVVVSSPQDTVPGVGVEGDF
jgi:hypothetical protein